jgi:hypothetical protein
MTASSMDWAQVVNQLILQPLHDSVARSAHGIRVSLQAYRTAPPAFWREILRQFLHSLGQGMCTNRAAAEFIKRLRSGTYNGMVVVCCRERGN